MVVICILMGLASIGYGATVMAVGSGSSFFLVWYALGVALLGAAGALRAGFFCLLPLAVLRVGAALLAVLTLSVGVALGLVLGQMGAPGEPDLDYLVVLGAQIYDDGSPSPVLRYRLDAARAYLRENPRTQVVVSGGQGPNEPYPEARGMADYLVAHDVAAGRVLQEPRSVNTLQNITFSKALMVDPHPRVGIVTNDFHVYRAVRIARKAGLDGACGIAAYSTPWYLPNNLLREALGLVKDLLVGNI